MFSVLLFHSSAALSLWKPLSEPSRLSSPGSVAGYPQLGRWKNEMVVVWEERMGQRWSIWGSLGLNGGKKWAAAKRLSPPEISARFPRLAISEKGEMVVVWKRSGDLSLGRELLYSQSCHTGSQEQLPSAGFSCSSPIQIMSSHFSPIRSFDLSVLESGIAVVWNGFDPGRGFGIYFQRGSFQALHPTLALAAGSRRQTTQRENNVSGKSIGNGSKQDMPSEFHWSDPLRLAESETLDRPAAFPAMAVFQNRIAVAWQDLHRDLTPLHDPIPDDWRVVLKISQNGGETWTSEIDLSAGFHFAYRPALLWRDRANLTCLWRNKDQRISWFYQRSDISLPGLAVTHRGRIPFPHLYVDGLRLLEGGGKVLACWSSAAVKDDPISSFCGDLEGNILLQLKAPQFQGYPSVVVEKENVWLAWQGDGIFVRKWRID